MILLPPSSTLFPYTTLFRSGLCSVPAGNPLVQVHPLVQLREVGVPAHAMEVGVAHQDRKSTRLNSSHRTISYAVFCLKKKIYKLRKALETMYTLSAFLIRSM